MAVVEHGAVPDPAQLVAADGEAAQLLGLGVSDVVDPRVGVRLHAELVGPEAVDDVQRGHVEPDLLPPGQEELRALHAAELGEPVGEGPLLADHLHHEPVRGIGLPDRRGALAGARARRGDQLDRAEHEQAEHDDRGGADPSGLDPGVAVDRRAVGLVTRALAPGDQRIPRVDPDEQ